MVVVVVSYLLAASVVQVLERRRVLVFWLLRSVGLVAYVVLAATGHACGFQKSACVADLGDRCAWSWGNDRVPCRYVCSI
jgi:hypothetical protein